MVAGLPQLAREWWLGLRSSWVGVGRGERIFYFYVIINLFNFILVELIIKCYFENNSGWKNRIGFFQIYMVNREIDGNNSTHNKLTKYINSTAN